MGSYDDYTKQQKVACLKADMVAACQAQNQINSGSGILQFMAPAPMTKENPPKGKDAKMSGK